MSYQVNVVIPPLEQSFTYDVPEALSKYVAVGSFVEVPFGRRKAMGYVVSTPDTMVGGEEFNVKPVTAAPVSYPCFLPEQIEFFSWVADYYGDSLANVIDVAVPAPAPQRFNRTVHLVRVPEERLRGKIQKELILHLQESSTALNYSEILKRWKGAGNAIKALESKGYIRIESEEIIDQHIDTAPIPGWAKTDVELDDHQQTATEQIVAASNDQRFASFALHGVTGSGKTEVYIEVIERLRTTGKGALVIVPEIALTPQLVDRFRARLGREIAVLHSGLNKRSRWDSWRALLEKRNYVAIGARSGVFAPVPNLGVVIVDEEHDPSYKQNEGLRYNARDLAVVRAKLHSCPVVLGSATLSLESYYNARRGKFTLLKLPARHESASNVTIQKVDLNAVKPWEMISRNISPQLYHALETVIEKDEQAFILYNRRGFASYLQCERCETVVECPNCSVTFTYHQKNNSLLCHYCNLSMVPAQYCAACSASLDAARTEGKEPPYDEPGTLQQRGGGTERVYEELCELFPGVVIDRLDRDAAKDTETYKEILGRVRSGETKILVGTQMIAKGHDLPGVTLVGIVDCDIGLHMPDFRAGERVFQLLTQASGRAGRSDKPGTVVLQTRVPTHPSITKTLKKDYEGFALSELAQRKALHYPPYSHVLRIIASSQDRALPESLLFAFRARLEELNTEEALSVQILGPTPAPLVKLKTLWRYHMLLKCESRVQLNKALKVLKSAKCSNKIRLVFDVDPQDML